MIDTLREWSLMLVITSFVGGLSSFVISESNKTMKKYVKFACSIVALAIMAAPIKGLLAEMPNIFKSSENIQTQDYSTQNEKSNEWILTKSVEDLKSGISNAVQQKFGIKTSGVYIYIKQAEDDGTEMEIVRKAIEIEKIRIEFLYSETDNAYNGEGVIDGAVEIGEGIETAEKIEKYLRDLLECEVIVEAIEF